MESLNGRTLELNLDSSEEELLRHFALEMGIPPKILAHAILVDELRFRKAELDIASAVIPCA
jgi:hypothetical protein